jgi:hypothetical protein
VFPVDGVVDEEGKPETSCIIHLDTEDEGKGLTKEEKREQKILRFVAKHPGITKTAVAVEVGGRKSDTFNAVDELVSAGRLHRDSDHRLRLPDLLNTIPKVQGAI